VDLRLRRVLVHGSSDDGIRVSREGELGLVTFEDTVLRATGPSGCSATDCPTESAAVRLRGEGLLGFGTVQVYDTAGCAIALEGGSTGVGGEAHLEHNRAGVCGLGEADLGAIAEGTYVFARNQDDYRTDDGRGLCAPSFTRDCGEPFVP
jgi:hypothetical protein